MAVRLPISRSTAFIAVAIGLILWLAYTSVQRSATARSLASALADTTAIVDDLRKQVEDLDDVATQALADLDSARAQEVERLVVIERDRDRSIEVSDSTWNDLYGAIEESFPELLPLATAVDTARKIERNQWERQNEAMGRLLAISDSTANVFENRFNAERELRFGLEAQVRATERDRDFYKAEASKLAIPGLLGDLPKVVQIVGKVAVCGGAGFAGYKLSSPEAGVAAASGCALGTIF